MFSSKEKHVIMSKFHGETKFLLSRYNHTKQKNLYM